MYAGLIVRLVDHSSHTVMRGVVYKCPKAGIMRLSSRQAVELCRTFSH